MATTIEIKVNPDAMGGFFGTSATGWTTKNAYWNTVYSNTGVGKRGGAFYFSGVTIPDSATVDSATLHAYLGVTTTSSRVLTVIGDARNPFYLSNFVHKN